MPSPCYNGRNINGVRLIVLHTAEGATTIESLGNFFSNYNNQVSSHTGADDKLGKIGEYVTRGNASWTCANYNPVAVQMELCGFASWSESTWKNQHHNMLENCARWIAEESAKLGIPIVKLSAGQAQGTGRGVCQHRDLGAGGGGHTDCGNGFPMDYVINLAKNGTVTTPPSGGMIQMSNVTIPIGAGKTDIAIPVGATRVRIYGSDDSGGAAWSATLDWRGGGTTENPDASANGDKVSDWKIPPDVKGLRFKRRDNGNFPLSISFG
jgi:hypothetical protein